MSNETVRFLEQLKWNPELVGSLSQGRHAILGGMGGSHLAAGLFKVAYPGIDLYVHRDYNLPPYTEDFFKQSMCIASSYSGNTEETLSFYTEAHKRGYAVAVITSGGKLLELAKKNNHPYILLPSGLQPRDALGYFVKALATIVPHANIISELNAFAEKISGQTLDEEAPKIAKELLGKIPLIYSSLSNLPLAYVWKISLNETAKSPAFLNVFPELNHNEMEGFDTNPGTAPLVHNFYTLILKDSRDNPKITKRMSTLRDLYVSKGMGVIEVGLLSESPWHTIAHAVELAHTLARLMATSYGINPNEVPLIEEFKRKIA